MVVPGSAGGREPSATVASLRALAAAGCGRRAARQGLCYVWAVQPARPARPHHGMDESPSALSSPLGLTVHLAWCEARPQPQAQPDPNDLLLDQSAE